jgi:hypothetical protein
VNLNLNISNAAGKVTTTAIALTPSYNGIGSTTYTTTSLNITAAVTIVKSPDTGLNQVAPVNFISLSNVAIQNSNQEVTFGLAKNVLPSTSPLSVVIQTNNLVSNQSIYLLQVVHKDRVVW